MSKGLQVLLERKIENERVQLPIGKQRAEELVHEINTEGPHALRGFNLGIAAARVVAGAADPLQDERGRHVPFIVNAAQNDTGRFWFNRGLFLLAPPLDIHVDIDALRDVNDIDTLVAYHEGAGLGLTAQRLKRGPMHDYEDLPPEAQEVLSFTVVPDSELAKRSILAVRA